MRPARSSHGTDRSPISRIAKRAEEALRESEARLAETERELRRTLDSIPTITWRAAPNGYVQQLNKRWFDYTGTTPEQMRGRGWKSAFILTTCAGFRHGRVNVTAGKPSTARRACAAFDGEYRWFLFRPAPARDETGNDRRMVRNRSPTSRTESAPKMRCGAVKRFLRKVSGSV